MNGLRRRTVFALMVLGTIPFFAVVHGLVNSTRAWRQTIAVEWAAQGDRDLSAGRADRAVEDYRAAGEYARDANAYRLPLSGALVAGNHLTQARAQLQTLWAETPGDGVVNAELARIAARGGDETEAVRYYHAAIDGAWAHDAASARRRLRTELATFLIARRDITKAQAELIALSDDLPADVGAATDTAALLLEAGAPARAAVVAGKALAIAPDNARALRLAGEAAFTLGDYRSAARDLARAGAASPIDADGARMLDMSTRVLAIDPFERRISSREHLRRIVRAFAIAQTAIARCPAGALADLRARVAAAAPRVGERQLAGDPEAVDETLSLVTGVEASIDAACGRAQGDEAALQLVLKQRRPAS